MPTRAKEYKVNTKVAWSWKQVTKSSRSMVDKKQDTKKNKPTESKVDAIARIKAELAKLDQKGNI